MSKSKKQSVLDRWSMGLGTIYHKFHGRMLSIMEPSKWSDRKGEPESSPIRANLWFKTYDQDSWRGLLTLILFEGKGHKDTRTEIFLTKENHDLPVLYKEMIRKIKKHLSKIDNELERKGKDRASSNFEPPTFAEFHAYSYHMNVRFAEQKISRSITPPVRPNEYVVAFKRTPADSIEIRTGTGLSREEAVGKVMMQNLKIAVTSVDSLQLDQFIRRNN